MPFFRFRRRRARLRARDLTPDCYLTDGHRLFRVVTRFVNEGSLLVVIEDCMTLDARAYTGVELAPLDLSPIMRSKPSPAGGPSPTSSTGGKPLEADTPAIAHGQV
jgi:hypothetical protein